MYFFSIWREFFPITYKNFLIDIVFVQGRIYMVKLNSMKNANYFSGFMLKMPRSEYVTNEVLRRIETKKKIGNNQKL